MLCNLRPWSHRVSGPWIMEWTGGVEGIHLEFQKSMFVLDLEAHAIAFAHKLPPFKIFFQIKEWEDELFLKQYLLIKVWAQRE